MWGNSLGWFLSLVLLGALVFGMHKLNQVGEISPPTLFGKDPAHLATVALPIAPSKVLPTTSSQDAAPLYRAAIDDYLTNRDAYDRFGESTELKDSEKLPALMKLLEAARAGKAAIFADDPGQVITYGDKPALEALMALGKLSARAALLRQLENPAEAIKYFEAEFALGARLYEERITVAEFSAGMELLSESSAGMIRLLQKTNQTSRAAEFRAFDEARLKYYNDQIKPMLTILQSIDANIIGEHAGDIFYLARESKEPMYRVEAILAMGRLKYFVGTDGRIGNQAGATQELKRLANSTDPLIQRAAVVARDLTIEQYRVMK